MPEEFNVLKCFKCETFQVYKVKKSKKWDCKMCGEKQSIKRNYGVGTGKDCRLHVQKLNSLRFDLTESACRNSELKIDNDELFQVVTPTISTEDYVDIGKSESSKWLQFIDEQKTELRKDIENISTGVNGLQEAKVVLEIPKPCRKWGKRNLPDAMSQPKCVWKCGNSNLTIKQSEPCYPAENIGSRTEILASIQPSSQTNNYSCTTQKSISKSETLPELEKKTIRGSSLSHSKWSRFAAESKDDNKRKPTSIQYESQSSTQDKVSDLCRIEQSENINFETYALKSHATDSLFSLTNDEALDDILSL